MVADSSNTAKKVSLYRPSPILSFISFSNPYRQSLSPSAMVPFADNSAAAKTSLRRSFWIILFINAVSWSVPREVLLRETTLTYAFLPQPLMAQSIAIGFTSQILLKMYEDLTQALETLEPSDVS